MLQSPELGLTPDLDRTELRNEPVQVTDWLGLLKLHIDEVIALYLITIFNRGFKSSW